MANGDKQDDQVLESRRITPSKITSTSLAERVGHAIFNLFSQDPLGGMGPMPLDFSLQKPANSIIAKIVNKVINARNEYYHGTYMTPAEAILRSGEIQPSASSTNPGVSLSRVPNMAFTEGMPIRFALDPG